MTTYLPLWILWGLLFALIEGSALRGIWARGGTLSELVWAWAGVRSGHWTWKRFALLAFLAWLLVHLAFGWLSL